MEKIQDLINALTLEEKVALVSGHNFMFTNDVPRLGIPSVRMSDGPHGLRIQNDDPRAGVFATSSATSFPTASCSANTFNPDLLKQMGSAIADEAKYYGINIVLGPGVNIKRNPLCGRNFEYFSEDPFLAGRLGAAEVGGLQNKGVGVSLKHFALNNLENYRYMGDSVADMRAIREIYLRQFEYIVKNAKPETVMCAYNKINGTHCSENKWLLQDVLRNEWGFEGLVMSDWGTTHDRIKGVKSGLDLEMPGDTDICRKWLFDAVNSGELDIKDLDKAVENVLNLVFKHTNDEKLESIDWEKHHQLAKDIAVEGAVLFKNGGLLPLGKDKQLLVVGEMFERMRYQGAGSSMIHPTFCTSPKEVFDKNGVDYKYVKGYHGSKVEVEQSLIDEAIEASRDFDKVLVFMGLTDFVESEGWDRDTLSLPQNQLSLVDTLVKTGKKVVVVLFGGSVVELPFFDDVDSILNMFLPGQNGGEATYNLLFGLQNPSGRVAETWPMSYQDVLYGDVYAKTVQELYKESIYVGYRYYITKGVEVRFPFGYGLSYTTFNYSDLHVEDKQESLLVSLRVKNTGKFGGKEVVQVYVSSPKENTHKPLRELKGFDKLNLKPGEEKTVTVEIKKEDLEYWDICENRFVLEDGVYNIQVCQNSRDVVLNKELHINGEKVQKTAQKPYELMEISNISDEEFAQIWGLEITPQPKKKPLTLESMFVDLKSTFMGKILYKVVINTGTKQYKKYKKMPDGPEKDNLIKSEMFMQKTISANSLMSLSMSSGGAFPYNFACGLRDLSNGHLFRGIKHMTKKIKAPALPIDVKESK